MENSKLLTISTATIFLFSGCFDVETANDEIKTEINTTVEQIEDIEDTVDTITQLTQSTTNPAEESYYKYLWQIDSKNSSEEKISQEISRALGDIYRVDPINEDADIDILNAWKITKGKDVIVAVIDDGFDVEHEDLKANIYLTYNADTDSNDVSNTSNDISHALHGNSCAGFISAPINGVGIIGTAPESKLIAIKQEEGNDLKTIRAFEYARDHGAKVISCSWGTEYVSDAVVSELKSLYDDGITVLFASGNDTKDLDNPNIYDESEVEWVIGVSASGENNDVTYYSNYGNNIDILAPGGDASNSTGLLGLDDSGTQGSTENYGLVSNSYSFMNGTSFSAPIASGVVALMYSVNPNITPKQVRDILIETATKIGVDSNYNSDGFDERRAYGKVDAYKAVLSAKALNN